MSIKILFRGSLHGHQSPHGCWRCAQCMHVQNANPLPRLAATSRLRALAAAAAAVSAASRVVRARHPFCSLRAAYETTPHRAGRGTLTPRTPASPQPSLAPRAVSELARTPAPRRFQRHARTRPRCEEHLLGQSHVAVVGLEACTGHQIHEDRGKLGGQIHEDRGYQIHEDRGREARALSPRTCNARSRNTKEEQKERRLARQGLQNNSRKCPCLSSTRGTEVAVSGVRLELRGCLEPVSMQDTHQGIVFPP